MLEEPSDSAQTTPTLGGSVSAPTETSALAQSRSHAAASGEIRNEWSPPSNGTTTLIGVTAFPAVRDVHDTIVDGARVIDGAAMFDASRLFVTPATVAAIAKAKQRPTDPTIQVDLESVLPLSDFERERAKAHELNRAERADAFAKLRRDSARISKPHRISRPERISKPQPLTAKVEAPSGPNRWQTFEDLGLAPKPITKKAQKLVVSTYRLIGFGILSLIVFVLLGYIGSTAFYFFNRSWITPVAISANDEKVVTLQSQLAAQLNERAKLVADLAESERMITAEQTFQLQFARAIKKDLQGRRVALDRVKQLSQTAAATRSEIRSTNDDYSSQAASTMADDYKAKLIDRNAMLAGKFQLAQITSANLSLAERQAEYDQRAQELATQTQSLDAILADKTASSALSYDVLKIARDYEASKLALARERSNRERLKASLVRQDKIIQGITSAPYLKALTDNATVALVPYSNLDNVAKGAPLYSCRANMVLCHQVGTVLDVLPGEVLVKHPNRDSMLRGRMIEMQLTDGAAAQDEVLFAGRAPLGI